MTGDDKVYMIMSDHIPPILKSSLNKLQ